jgi:large conductance mechanosensitive channel
MWREFKAFLVKDNVLSLAIAVVIGAAVGKVVTAVVDDFIMPVVATVTPGGNWRAMTASVGPVNFLVGHFLGTLLDFLIVGFVVWRIAKALIRPSPGPAATKGCPYCKSTIDATATRCSHCTSQLAAA